MFGSANSAAKMAQQFARLEAAKKEKRIAAHQKKAGSSSDTASVTDSVRSIETDGSGTKSRTSRGSGLFGKGRKRSNSHSTVGESSGRSMVVEVTTEKNTVCPPVRSRKSAPASAHASSHASSQANVKTSVTAPRPAVPSPPSLNDQTSVAHRTLQTLRATIATQEDRESQLSLQIRDAVREAKTKLQSGNKMGAVRSMKRSKRLQAEQMKIGAAIENLESLSDAIEAQLNSLDVMQAMRAGSNAMKSLQGDHPHETVEQVDDLIMDIRDTLDIEKEINAILTAPVQHIVEDDDDLLRELDGLDDMMDISQAPVAPTKALPPPNGRTATSSQSFRRPCLEGA